MLDYGFNRYLWQHRVVTGRANDVTVVQLADLMPDQLTTGGGSPTWHLAMAAAQVVMLPPILIVIQMQRRVVRGLFVKEQKAQGAAQAMLQTTRHDRRKKGKW